MQTPCSEKNEILPGNANSKPPIHLTFQNWKKYTEKESRPDSVQFLMMEG